MNHIYTEIFCSEFLYIEIWFTVQNFGPLEIEHRIILTLVIYDRGIYCDIQLNPRIESMSKAMDFILCKKMGSNYGQKLFVTTKKSAPIPSGLPQKWPTKNRQKQQVIWLEKRLQKFIKAASNSTHENTNKSDDCTTNRDV